MLLPSAKHLSLRISKEVKSTEIMDAMPKYNQAKYQKETGYLSIFQFVFMDPIIPGFGTI